MTKEPAWVSKAVALAIHERLLAAHGGAPGLLDEGLLEAALANPLNRFAYEQADVFRLAAAYAYGITQNHPFTDGNKRVALTLAGVFLELNGFRLEASEQDAVQAMLALSSRQMTEPEYAEWLRRSSSPVGRAPRARARRRRSAAAAP